MPLACVCLKTPPTFFIITVHSINLSHYTIKCVKKTEKQVKNELSGYGSSDEFHMPAINSGTCT